MSKARVVIQQKDGTVIFLKAISTMDSVQEIKEYLKKDLENVFVRGAVTSRFLDVFIKNRGNFDHVNLVAIDGTRFFISYQEYQKALACNLSFYVMNTIHLLFVSCNPHSPLGVDFPKKEFQNKLQQEILCHVIDVKEGEKMRFIDERSIERIGFNRLLSRVEILSNYGEEKLKNLKPFVPGEEEALERNFEEIQQFINFSEETDRKSFLLTLESCIHRMKNIKKLIRMVENGNVLDEVELFEVKVQAIYMEKLQECLQELPAELQGFSLQPLNKILEALDPQSDRNPTFYLYESYSRQLTALREQRKK
ncbi:hypothetical protein HMPREF9466_02039 [Fusobacterium necrophorum subsp. funduliforme 1_1_36S]|nr:hypothetical protein HMPREF9466_02039 [Fusobacterium necrophorum subsp. funduliforme 1_1_36S]